MARSARQIVVPRTAAAHGAGTVGVEMMFLFSALGAALLWTAVLIREWPRLMVQGSICGESVGLLGHCPLCAPAVALTVVTMALAVISWRRQSDR